MYISPLSGHIARNDGTTPIPSSQRAPSQAPQDRWQSGPQATGRLPAPEAIPPQPQPPRSPSPTPQGVHAYPVDGYCDELRSRDPDKRQEALRALPLLAPQLSKSQRYEVLCALALRSTVEEMQRYGPLLADHAFPIEDGYGKLILTLSFHRDGVHLLEHIPLLPNLPKVHRADRSSSKVQQAAPQPAAASLPCSGAIPPAPPFPFDGYGTFCGKEEGNETWQMLTHTLRGCPPGPTEKRRTPNTSILPSARPEAALHPNIFQPYGYFTEAFVTRALDNKLTEAEASIWSKHIADQRARLTQSDGTWATRYAALSESDAVFTVICEGLDETARSQAVAERDTLLGFAETMVEGMRNDPAQVFHDNHDWELFSFAAVYALTRLGERCISPAEFETLTIWRLMCVPYEIGPGSWPMHTQDIKARCLVENGTFTEAARRWLLPDLELDAAQLERLEAEASNLPPGERVIFTAKWPKDREDWPSIIKRFDSVYRSTRLFFDDDHGGHYEYFRPCVDTADDDARIIAMPSGSLSTLIAHLRHGERARPTRRLLAFPSGRKILDDLAAGERSASLIHASFLPFQRNAIADGHLAGAFDLLGHDRRYHENMLSFFPLGFEAWVPRLVCALQAVWDAEYTDSHEFKEQWQDILWAMSDMNFSRPRKSLRQGVAYTLADFICDLRPGSNEIRGWTAFAVAEAVHEIVRHPDFFGDNHKFTDGPLADLLQSLYDALRDIYAAEETPLRPLQIAVAIRRFNQRAHDRRNHNDTWVHHKLTEILIVPKQIRLELMWNLRDKIEAQKSILHFEQNMEPAFVRILRTNWESDKERALAVDMVRLMLDRQTHPSDWTFRSNALEYRVVKDGWPELASYCKNVTQPDFDAFTPLIAAVYQNLAVLEAFLTSANADICHVTIAKWGPRVYDSGLLAILRTQKVEALAMVVRHLQNTSPSFLHALMERSVNSACRAAADQHTPEAVRSAFDELFSTQLKTLLPALRQHDPASADKQQWDLATASEPTAIALAKQLGLPKTATMLHQDLVLQRM